LVHLQGFKDRYPAELSGGQQQRVALARALVVEPEILLMDEPLSNLDANLREEMRFEIRRLHEEFGITTVYVTHDQSEAMATSDRIAVLNHGRMVQAGRPAEIFDHPETRFVAEFIGKANLLSGRLENGNRLHLAGGLSLKVAPGAGRGLEDTVSVCLRPHNVELTADEAQAQTLESRGYNRFAGVIQRRIHFGESVDYTVELLPQAILLRVIAAPSRLYAKGQNVYALALPEHCVVVAAD
jgi:iron(III) transport system ATP-binding protein